MRSPIVKAEMVQKKRGCFLVFFAFIDSFSTISWLRLNN